MFVYGRILYISINAKWCYRYFKNKYEFSENGFKKHNK